MTVIPIGQEDRRKGTPRTDYERRLRHYEETGEWPLPERGYGLGQDVPIGTGFWSSLTEFVRTYPWQTITVVIAIVAIMVNIKSTKRIVQSLELKRR